MIDRDLLQELQYVLIEPPDGGDTWPSLIWTRQEVLDAVNGGVQRLVRDCHLTVTRTELEIVAGSSRVDLPIDWVATASLVWRAADNTRTPLGPADAFEADLATPGWEFTHGLPVAYADLDSETLTLRLIPTPLDDGILELLYVQVPALITAAGAGLPLPVADEFVSALKYDALSWLLRKVGRLLDAERAAYCDRRYELTQIVTEIILGGWA